MLTDVNIARASPVHIDPVLPAINMRTLKELPFMIKTINLTAPYSHPINSKQKSTPKGAFSLYVTYAIVK